MRIALGADHAGFPLKGTLLEFLKSEGHEVLDLGTNSTDPVDYPDFAKAVALFSAGKPSEDLSCVGAASAPV